MKKSMTLIAKMMLKSALALAGVIAFLYFVGGPNEEWFDNARKTFGWFTYGWLFVEKGLAGLSIYLVYKLGEWIGPVFEDDEVSPKAAEE